MFVSSNRVDSAVKNNLIFIISRRIESRVSQKLTGLIIRILFKLCFELKINEIGETNSSEIKLAVS